MKRKYQLDETYFDNIDSHEKAYILGFLAADGYNHHKKGEIIITQVFEGREILEKISLAFNSNIPVTSRSRERLSDVYKLSIYSRKLSDKLNDIGIVQNKSHVLEYPSIEEQYDCSFILGYFDGDGCISIDPNQYNRGSLSFTGNISIIQSIRDKIRIKTNYPGSLTTRNSEVPNIVSLSYCGNINTVTIMDWLYSNKTIWLDRKKAKYDQLSSIKVEKEEIKNKKLQEIEETIRIKQENLNIETNKIISLLDNGFSIRQISLQFGIDKRKVRKIINTNNYGYPTRKRMFAKDPKTSR